MHADAKAHTAVFGLGIGEFIDLCLDRQRSGDRAHYRAEHRQHRIARHVDDAPLLRLDLHTSERGDGGGHRRSVRREPRRRSVPVDQAIGTKRFSAATNSRWSIGLVR